MAYAEPGRQAVSVMKRNILFPPLRLKETFVFQMSIPGVPEKAERSIFSTLRAESVVYFYIIR